MNSLLGLRQDSLRWVFCPVSSAIFYRQRLKVHKGSATRPEQDRAAQEQASHPTVIALFIPCPYLPVSCDCATRLRNCARSSLRGPRNAFSPGCHRGGMKAWDGVQVCFLFLSKAPSSQLWKRFGMTEVKWWETGGSWLSSVIPSHFLAMWL